MADTIKDNMSAERGSLLNRIVRKVLPRAAAAAIAATSVGQADASNKQIENTATPQGTTEVDNSKIRNVSVPGSPAGFEEANLKMGPDRQEIIVLESTDILSPIQFTSAEVNSLSGVVSVEPTPTATAVTNTDGTFSGLPVTEANSPLNNLVYGHDNYHVAGAPNGEEWDIAVNNASDLIRATGEVGIVFIREGEGRYSIVFRMLNKKDFTVTRSASDATALPPQSYTVEAGSLIVFDIVTKGISIVQPFEGGVPAVIRSDAAFQNLISQSNYNSPLGSLLLGTVNAENKLNSFVTTTGARTIPADLAIEPQVVYKSAVSAPESAPLSAAEVAIRRAVVDNITPVNIRNSQEWKLNTQTWAYERTDPRTGQTLRYRSGMGTVEINGSYLEDDIRKGQMVEVSVFSESFEGKTLTIVFEGQSDPQYRDNEYFGLAFEDEVNGSADARQTFVKGMMETFPSFWENGVNNVTFFVPTTSDDVSAPDSINRWNSGGLGSTLGNAVATGHEQLSDGVYVIRLSPAHDDLFAKKAFSGFFAELFMMTGQTNNFNINYGTSQADKMRRVAFSTAEIAGLEVGDISGPNAAPAPAIWKLVSVENTPAQLGKIVAGSQTKEDRDRISNMNQTAFLKRSGAYEFTRKSVAVVAKSRAEELNRSRKN